MFTRPRQHGVHGLEQNAQDAAFDVHDLKHPYVCTSVFNFTNTKHLFKCPAHGNMAALDAVRHFHSCVLAQGKQKRCSHGAVMLLLATTHTEATSVFRIQH